MVQRKLEQTRARLEASREIAQRSQTTAQRSQAKARGLQMRGERLAERNRQLTARFSFRRHKLADTLAAIAARTPVRGALMQRKNTAENRQSEH